MKWVMEENIREKIHDLQSLTIRQTDMFCASVDSTDYLLGHVTVLHETNS